MPTFASTSSAASRAARPRPAPDRRGLGTCAAAATTIASCTPHTTPPCPHRRADGDPRQDREGLDARPGIEARNVTHQAKKMNIDELKKFRDRLELPISDKKLEDAPFYHPGPDAPRCSTCWSAGARSAGTLPKRRSSCQAAPRSGRDEAFEEFFAGTDRPASTTTACSRLTRNLVRGPAVGQARGPDHSGRGPHLRHGGAVPGGRDLPPVGTELRSGRLGAPALATARRRTASSSRRASPRPARWARSRPPAPPTRQVGQPIIPFYIFYSMFGSSGSATWCGVRRRARRGFLLGATAGRTTLNGEGLQHDDGHPHLFASTFPNVRPPTRPSPTRWRSSCATASTACTAKRRGRLLLRHALQRELPPAGHARGRRGGNSRGLYRFRPAERAAQAPRPDLRMGSDDPGRRSAHRRCWPRSSTSPPTSGAPPASSSSATTPSPPSAGTSSTPVKERRVPLVRAGLAPSEGPIIAATDYMKALPDLVSRWIDALHAARHRRLRTQRHAGGAAAALRGRRRAHHVRRAVWALPRRRTSTPDELRRAIGELRDDPDRLNPLFA